MKAVIPDVDQGRRYAEHRERGADLAPMIGPMVKGLREPDPDWRATLEGAVVLHKDRFRVEVLCEDAIPVRAVPLHGGPELCEVHSRLVRRGRPARDREQVRAVTVDEVAHRLEDRAVGPGNNGRLLLRAQRQAGIDQQERRPHMVRERVPKRGGSHAGYGNSPNQT